MVIFSLYFPDISLSHVYKVINITAQKETAGSSRSPAAEVRCRLHGRLQGAPVERGNEIRSCCQARTGERYPCRSRPCGPSSWPGCHELFFRKDSGGTKCRLADRSTHVVVSFCLTHMGCFSIVLAWKSKFLSTYFYSRGNQRHCFRRDLGGALIIGKNH